MGIVEVAENIDMDEESFRFFTEGVFKETKAERELPDADDYIIRQFPHGNKEWRDGQGRFHRNNGPAIIIKDGGRAWYQHGEYHREDGPAYTEPNGLEIWYYKGTYHRIDGPAFISPGNFEWWYLYGKLHRTDGPAVTRDKEQGWYLYGQRYKTEADWEQAKQKLNLESINQVLSALFS